MNTRFNLSSGVYIIAEIGINHNGDLDEAKKLIRDVAKAGADSVKIQVRHLPSLYTRSVLEDPLEAEQGTQYLMNEIKKANLSFAQITALKEYARQFSVDFFATPFDITSARFLNSIGIELFKIGSPDLTNLPLLAEVASYGKPMILSTGMSEEFEIKRVIDFLKKKNCNFALLHCNSTYPAPYHTLNLRYMQRIKEFAGVKVGYSGHEQGFAPTLAAVALGAKIIERHITSDNLQSGPDHRSSLQTNDFCKMVEGIRAIEASLGEPKRIYNQGERNNRLSLAKSLTVTEDLKVGTILLERHLTAKTPAKGVSPLELDYFIGKRLSRDLKEDDFLCFEDVSNEETELKNEYKINRTWGIVGRLNDFRDFLSLKPDLIEIHMTWRDLFDFTVPSETFSQDLVVHAPEYFQDQLIDFTSCDQKVVDQSFEMLRRTIQIARDLAPRFKGQKNSQGPRIVVHPGGHFSKATDSNKTEQYRLLKKRLREINSDGVRILIENMPPRPWYFGGQWYNTIFLDPAEIAQFASEMGWGICYDTSHAQLYCNFAGLKLAEFTKSVLNHIAYLHLSDAKGISEEGLQIGQGDIDFEQLFALLKHTDCGFIPEIWQGHLNGGKGFKEALRAIESTLHKVSGESCSKTHFHSSIHHHREKA